MLTGEVKHEEKTRTVGELYKETERMIQREMEELKKRPLSSKEKSDSEKMARIMANHVLRQMGII